MRLVLLTLDHPWQRALAGRLARSHDLALVVVEEQSGPVSRTARLTQLLKNPQRVWWKLREVLAGSPRKRQATSFARHFETIGAPPLGESARNIMRVRNINSAEVAQAIEAANPDAIIVSGGRILRDPVLRCASRYGMINMHPGLSPYYRGIACTFWSLYNEEPEYAGVTIHYLTAGIDSGDIILSGRPPLEESDTAASLECKVVELGHRLVLQALELLAQGRAPRVPQWEQGRLFQFRELTPRVQLELEHRLQRGLMARCLRRLRERPAAVRIVEAP